MVVVVSSVELEGSGRGEGRGGCKPMVSPTILNKTHTFIYSSQQLAMFCFS